MALLAFSLDHGADHFVHRLLTAIMLSYTTFAASFASAIFSSTIGEVSKNFHVGAEVATLGISLYVLGFAFGKPSLPLVLIAFV